MISKGLKYTPKEATTKIDDVGSVVKKLNQINILKQLLQGKINQKKIEKRYRYFVQDISS